MLGSEAILLFEQYRRTDSVLASDVEERNAESSCIRFRNPRCEGYDLEIGGP